MDGLLERRAHKRLLVFTVVREVERELSSDQPTQLRIIAEPALLFLLQRCGGVVEPRLIGPALYRFPHRLDLFLPKARADRHKNQPPDSVGVPGRIEQRDKTPVRVTKQVHSIEFKVVLKLTEIGDVIVERVPIS